MGNETGSSWSPHQSLMLHSPKHDSLILQSLTDQSLINSMRADVVATNLASFGGEGSPPFAFTGVAPSQNGQFNQPRGWFYCLPRFRQTFTPGLSCSVPKEKIPLPADGSCDTPASDPSSGDNMRKKFIVFDQSGDRTTLMANSGMGTPFQCISSWSLKYLNLPSTKKIEVKADLCPYGATWKQDKCNVGSDSLSQMHEDSDELDALLYSSDDEDDSDYSEDDEVTSTGHSPSTMTIHARHGSQESVNEVATRKRKLIDRIGDDVAAHLDDTASSGNSVNRYIEHSNGDDCGAQSSCGNGGEMSSTKRMRKEKIRETVSILRDMIPGGKGKDAVVVLDEAIHYLKSLKVKTKALGLATL